MALDIRQWLAGAGAARVWQAMQSRVVLGCGYGLAAALTGLAILLAASPPSTGPLGPASQLILTVLGLNLVLILALTLVLFLRFAALFDARERDAGARLQVRFVLWFAFAAVVPALVVFLFYGVLVTRGVDNWFSHRVKTVVESSAAVARSYVEEQQQYIHDHVIPMGEDLNHAEPAFEASPITFSHFLGNLANFHGFSAGYLIDRDGRVLARAEAADAPPLTLPPASSFKAADQGIISVCNVNCGDVMSAVYKLRSYSDAYLYVIRPVEKGLVGHLVEAEASLIDFRAAAQNRERIQTIFALSYAETALLVLVGAVWLGLGAANAISGPVARLVQAAGKVAGGDLSARVDAENDPEEIAVLSRAFNSMTHDLQEQQEAIRTAHEDAERRRQFIETVLAEVSAGVISLDAKGRISAANRQAELLLGLDAPGRGRKLLEVAPEIAAIVAQAGRGEAEEEVDVVRGRETRRLRVRVSGIEGGLVLTFDDITRLMNAQRNAAWRDVARRIAHEIKNPLTPIQLSAERLRKKYRKDIPASELEIFDRCNDTIVRQVDAIRQMVDEFSTFARMPAPKFVDHDASELIRAAVFAQRVASPDIDVELVEPVPEVRLLADERMLTQALTNILKNAAEAVTARRTAKPPKAKERGRIRARLISDDSGVAFEVEDNGVGLPAKDRDRLTEPYVTTREKGTGLGLAIVKRILEDHGGELELTDAREGPGALATLRLPPSARARPAPKSQTVTA
ncbi:MAG TPA: PAS domain-containing sensor histidine kinase [Phenylobacterium sp.]|jgi:two-component system nitrogen regulation sensor histidine kinase NtrY|uniref:sensor histidine kinase NtrY-like n=1 Tax=Phenylobacterium sp. TaxID=1871053 RepID=UPI002CDDBC16|nr:PAS domain-containing sensor histidine kinase [Phenylobacterium sp.]HXA38517.1 PAS domain-containing sensor histidine kinase [Phenylobacterium sp.]